METVLGGELLPDNSHYQLTLTGSMSFGSGQNNMYHSLDTNGEFEGPSGTKQKKGNGVEGTRIKGKQCKVCGDDASGYRYGALTCSSCKKFFQYCSTKTAKYTCKYNGNCVLNMCTRRKCRACRLRRCRQVGMKECLLLEDDFKAKNAKQKSCSMSEDSGNPMKKLSQEERELVTTLIALQDKYKFVDQQSYEETLKDFVARMNDSSDLQTFTSSMALTVVLITQHIVEFAKGLPGFLTLSQEDQITLLKSSSTEVMFIWAARCYDLELCAIISENGQPCTAENMKAADQGRYCELLYEFCHNMATSKTDNVEYAIFTAICIFSERPGLNAKDAVEKIRNQYVKLLQVYETAKCGRDGIGQARILSRLADLRTISVEHSKFWIKLDANKKIQMFGLLHRTVSRFNEGN